uniref:Uncharacterized protein n=1 Tax=Plectus sambesii TaxID=2011161 RepID=A0A914VSY9_9BILA
MTGTVTHPTLTSFYRAREVARRAPTRTARANGTAARAVANDKCAAVDWRTHVRARRRKTWPKAPCRPTTRPSRETRIDSVADTPRQRLSRRRKPPSASHLPPLSQSCKERLQHPLSSSLPRSISSVDGGCAIDGALSATSVSRPPA